jgi:exosortase K
MTSYVRANGPALGLVALVVVATKQAYAHLGPDQLVWVAGPTQALVSLLTGIDFVHEAGYGYVNIAHRIVIARSCLGVNYLVMVFGMLAFTLVPATPVPRRKLLLLLPIAATAWASAILINSVRIALGIELHDAGLSWGWLTPERLHRAAGVAVYFVALVGLDRLARRVTRVPLVGERRSNVVAAPLLWYAFVALGVPIANGALFDRPRAFAEHGATVLILALLLAGALHALCVVARTKRAALTGLVARSI